MSRLLSLLIIAAILVGVALTALGLFAQAFPALDIVNNFTPLLAAGSILVLCLALVARDGRLVLAATLIAALNLGRVLSALHGGAVEAAPDSARFLRVVAFNVWRQNQRIDDVAKFLSDTNADVVIMAEMTTDHWRTLREALGTKYPYTLGESGLVMLSKHPILADGRIDRAGYPPWISLMLRWAEIEVNGTRIKIAGAHLARPFYPELQAQDVDTLIQFIRSQNLPLILAGDFNMTPWTDKFRRIERETGMRRINTFNPTWPMLVRGMPSVPVVAIDNVLASKQFAAIGMQAGPRLGSDHRPVIADIALK